MDYLGQDFELTSEYGSMSVDAILAEFREQSLYDAAEAEALSENAPERRNAQTKKAKGEHLSMPSKHRKNRDKPRRSAPVREERAAGSFEYTQIEISTPGVSEAPTTELRREDAEALYDSAPTSELRAEERESAFAYAASPAPGELFPDAPADEHPADPFAAASAAPQGADKPAAEPETEAAPEIPVYDRYAAEPSPRKSARPSDEEVRAFLDAFKRGDFLDLTEQEVSEPPIRTDERFYMGGERKNKLEYNGVEVDTSADESYRAPAAESFIASYAAEDGGDAEEPDQPSGAFGRMGAKLSGVLGRRGSSSRSARPAAVKPERRTQRVEEEEEAPPVREAASAAYETAREKAEDDARFESSFTDYGEGEYAVRREFETPDYDDLYDEAANPGSFREYLFARVAAFLYSFRRTGTTGAATMADEEEDLGRELSCAKASKYYGSFIRSMRLRLRISGILLFIMLWISLGLPVPGMLKTTAVSNAVVLGLQLGIMLLGLDTLTTGVMNAVRGKLGADSMAVLACLVTSLDAALTAKADFCSPHLALCLISSLSLCGEMCASVLHARAMRKSLRVPAIGKRCFAVTGETDSATGDVTILKSVRPPLGFVRRSEQSSPDEDLFRKLSLPLLAAAFLLALVIALLKKDFADFLYIFSALLCPAAPFAAMCCYSLPFFLGSMRIFSSGAAIAGWSGMSDIGQSKNLIVTDRDLFPDGTVEIGTIRIFADEDPNLIISYAGSMMAAAGSCSALSFGELMERNGCRTRNIQNFEFLAGGGMKGVIDGKVILCGSTDLMRLMNVRIPFRLVDKTSVLLAADGILCGIFNMKYTAKPQVREALIDLMRSNRHPVFAIRDFNVTPEMLHVAFDVATDGYDFPPYIDRFDMSAATPSEDSQIAAIICREGLGPLVHTADTARSMYTATRLNTLLTAISAVAGVVLAAVRLMGGAVPIPLLFFFMLFWALVSAAISFFMRL